MDAGPVGEVAFRVSAHATILHQRLDLQGGSVRYRLGFGSLHGWASLSIMADATRNAISAMTCSHRRMASS